jgi:hypothetical protein
VDIILLADAVHLCRVFIGAILEVVVVVNALD